MMTPYLSKVLCHKPHNMKKQRILWDDSFYLREAITAFLYNKIKMSKWWGFQADEATQLK